MRKSRTVSTKRLRETLRAEVQKKSGKKICSSGKMHYLCNALYMLQATESPISMPAAFFMPLAVINTSSVPCGALMRPLPVTGEEQRGAELFSFPGINQIY